MKRLVKEDTINEAAFGTWYNPSYGWLAAIEAGSISLYHMSKGGCMKDPAETEDLAGLMQYFDRSNEQLLVSMQAESSTIYSFDPFGDIPPACEQPIPASPKAVFDYFWGLMDDHYAFFDLYGIDWESRREQYASTVENDMTEAALFEVLTDMLDGLNDGHLGLSGMVGDEEENFNPSKPRVLEPALAAAFEAQTDIEKRGEFFTQWFFGSLKRFRNHVLDRRGQGKAAGGNMNWGRIGNIGYISVFGMGGFADDDVDSFEGELQAVHKAMNRALTDLADTDGLIFDIALNQGGMDEVSLALASHFTDQRQLAYTKKGYRSSAPAQPLYIQPAEGVRYLKPVTLFTSDLTVSAAEIFTMSMRALPTVTHRGDKTWGALSDILSKTLPNGWELELSNEIYEDADGIQWEGKGIEPAEKYLVFDPENIHQSHHNAILNVAIRMKSELQKELP